MMCFAHRAGVMVVIVCYGAGNSALPHPPPRHHGPEMAHIWPSFGPEQGRPQHNPPVGLQTGRRVFVFQACRSVLSGARIHSVASANFPAA